jgi:hypothetical protein
MNLPAFSSSRGTPPRVSSKPLHAGLLPKVMIGRDRRFSYWATGIVNLVAGKINKYRSFR